MSLPLQGLLRSGRMVRLLGAAIPRHNLAEALKLFVRPFEGLGSDLSDVIRTRILLTRIQDWEQVAQVHGEFFGEIRPANTIMQIVRFVDRNG